MASSPSRQGPRGHLGGDRDQSVSTVLLVSRVLFGSASGKAEIDCPDIGGIVRRDGIPIIWYPRPGVLKDIA